MRLSLMRVAPMHHHIDPVEPAFEKVPVGLELEPVRHDTYGIREHAILGDNGITFDVTRTGHGCSVLLFLNRTERGWASGEALLNGFPPHLFYHPYRWCEDGRGWRTVSMSYD